MPQRVVLIDTIKTSVHVQTSNRVFGAIKMWLALGNPPLTRKDKYLEIRNSVIQSVISQEGSKLHAYK